MSFIVEFDISINLYFKSSFSEWISTFFNIIILSFRLKKTPILS